ncbi:MAG: pyruvate carboxylase subunit B [Nitrospinota bacterium]
MGKRTENKRALLITDTTLRDAHQSLWATRMQLEDILPIAEKLDGVGYYSVEVWGGATFDVSLRYLEEDPWIRLREIKKRIKKTPLQMLLRGQNIVGYKNYPDDLLEAFIKKAVQGGIDIFRVFDALNDIRNVAKAIEIIKREGAVAQGSICYTRSPIHTLETYVETAKQLVDVGVDTINIKDMSGILTPYDAYDLVKSIKSETKKTVQLHCHSSSGMATAAYVKASEAGVDVVDCAAAPLALYTSQPAVETLVAIMENTQRETNLDFDLIHRISEYWEGVSEKRKLQRMNQSLIDVSVIEHQIPGGMVSNLIIQLEQQNALDKIEAVLLEVPKVRKDVGWPPLVTPMSQIVGTQAVFNVLNGSRYKIVSREIKDYVRGMYGKAPGAIERKVKQALSQGEKPITCRPADLLEPKLEKSKKELDLQGFRVNDEDVITYCLFPEVATEFFKKRQSRRDQNGIPKSGKGEISDIEAVVESVRGTSLSEFVCESNGRKISIRRDPDNIEAPFEPPVQMAPARPALDAEREKESEEDATEKISSLMVGIFNEDHNGDSLVRGSIVEKGQTIGTIKAMHVNNDIKSTFKCRILKKLIEQDEPVEYGQALYLVEPI